MGQVFLEEQAGLAVKWVQGSCRGSKMGKALLESRGESHVTAEGTEYRYIGTSVPGAPGKCWVPFLRQLVLNMSPAQLGEDIRAGWWRWGAWGCNTHSIQPTAVDCILYFQPLKLDKWKVEEMGSGYIFSFLFWNSAIIGRTLVNLRKDITGWIHQNVKSGYL